ncbi:ribonuclease HII [Candidatus Saccharibacteria bacterium]|nr:ribonuclease HII [Candidatus Saccharibacteria bacterium]
MVLGIDEVGRGPWAGPLVVGAVILGGVIIEGIDDSKKLTKKQRTVYAEQIQNNAKSVTLGWVSSKELDEIGMSSALKLATRRAVEQVTVPFHEIIIDGTVNFLSDTTLEQYVTTLAKADSLIPSVSAASIVAKVARDAYMAEQDENYPGYGFASHVGYGVAAHRAAIEKLGVTPLHRLSFAPLQKYRLTAYKAVNHQERTAHPVTTRMIGDASETIACRYLEAMGHHICERNWRTKWCEIDIISKKDNILYFTEVKHRRSSRGGSGFDAITARKQRKMSFAAELYAMSHDTCDLRLAVIATSGDDPSVDGYLQLS